jgi:hypothetical protein
MNVRAERDGNWLLHLQSVSSMLPHFFVGNKTNYARWTPVCLMDMMNLPDDIQKEFMSGKGLGAIRAKIGPTSDVDKIFSKMYSQYVLFINKYS